MEFWFFGLVESTIKKVILLFLILITNTIYKLGNWVNIDEWMDFKFTKYW